MLLLLLVVMVVTPAIVHGKKSEDSKLFEKSYKEAKKVWKDYVIDDDDKIMDYSYEYIQKGTSSSNTGGQVVGTDTILYVHVRDGKVESAFPKNPKIEDFGKPPPQLALVDDMLKEIGKVLKDNKDTVNTVVFNDEYGYPESFSITYEDGTDLDIRIENMVLYTVLQRELDHHMALWDKKMRNMQDNDYKFNTIISCYCFGIDYTAPKQITVTDGAISNVTMADGGMAYTTEGYYTIPEVFGRIQNAIDRYYYQIDVVYDTTTTYGFPTSVALDYHVLIADDVQNIRISDFVDLSESL